jgi:hypothetical protein
MTKALEVKTGDKYARLEIVKEVDRVLNKHGEPKRAFECKCDCGKTSIVGLSNLRSGGTKSCGCLLTDEKVVLARRKKPTHSHCTNGVSSRTYKSWVAMKTRVLNKKHPAYARYKDKVICDRWLQKFENFLEDMGERPNGKTLDRIDGTKGYYKENCRWATVHEQLLNRAPRKKTGPRKLIVHGTIFGYRSYKCRCILCKEANNIYARELYRRKKCL